jgi:hypothetical protein
VQAIEVVLDGGAGLVEGLGELGLDEPTIPPLAAASNAGVPAQTDTQVRLEMRQPR